MSSLSLGCNNDVWFGTVDKIAQRTFLITQSLTIEVENTDRSVTSRCSALRLKGEEVALGWVVRCSELRESKLRLLQSLVSKSVRLLRLVYLFSRRRS